MSFPPTQPNAYDLDTYLKQLYRRTTTARIM